MESMVILIFIEPLCEVCTSCRLLGYPIAVICIDRHMFVCGLWLQSCCVGCVWNLGPGQRLEHGRVEAGMTFFVDDLANKTVIFVGRPVPHLREAMRKFTLYWSELP
jgi:hypothetical protein